MPSRDFNLGDALGAAAIVFGVHAPVLLALRVIVDAVLASAIVLIGIAILVGRGAAEKADLNAVAAMLRNHNSVSQRVLVVNDTRLIIWEEGLNAETRVEGNLNARLLEVGGGKFGLVSTREPRYDL